MKIEELVIGIRHNLVGNNYMDENIDEIYKVEEEPERAKSLIEKLDDLINEIL